MPDLFGWYTPTSPGESIFGGDDTPQFANVYEQLFAGQTNVWEKARELGYTGAMPVQGTGEDSPYQVGNPRQELMDWMQSSGYTYGVIPTQDGGQINAWLDPQGQVIPGTQQEFAGGDSNFAAASLAMGAALGGIGMSHAGLLGGAAAGGSGVGTLGTIPAGAGQVAPLSTMGTVGATTLPEVAGLGAAAGGAAALPPGAVAGTGMQTITVNGGAAAGGGIGTLPSSLGAPLGTVASLPTNAQAGISTIPTSSSFSWDSILQGLSNGGARSIFDIGSGLYGMSLASDARKASDPFAQHRAGYGAKLQALEANPSSITQTPGWRAGLEGVDRQAAARGYYGSGNLDAARSQYAGNFYQNETARLAQLAGASQTPGAGQFNSAQLASQSLASIGYGLAPWIGGRQP